MREDARECADERHLEAVENPRDPEPDDDQPVPPAPRQPVEAVRDHRLDDPAGQRSCAGGACGGHAVLVTARQPHATVEGTPNNPAGSVRRFRPRARLRAHARTRRHLERTAVSEPAHPAVCAVRVRTRPRSSPTDAKMRPPRKSHSSISSWSPSMSLRNASNQHGGAP